MIVPVIALAPNAPGPPDALARRFTQNMNPPPDSSSAPPAADSHNVTGVEAVWLDVADTDSDEHTRHETDGEHVVFGRTSGADITLPSPRVSRRHAELLRDPFGRWWLRDLGSRNGTRLNDVDVNEAIVSDGDRIGLGPFEVTVRGITTGANDATQPIDQTAALSIVDIDEPAISHLKDAAPAKIDTTHIASLREFGDAIAELDEPRERLNALCALLVRYDFPARTAMVVRIDRAQPDQPPKVLCEPQAMSDTDRELPYVSRSLVRSVAETGAPAIAVMGGARGDAGVIEMSIAPDSGQAMAACAAPVATRPDTIDVLYATLPAEYASAQWLALVALGAQQYKHVEASLIARKQAEQRAAIERELERASQIQARLVPKNIDIPGLEVAIGFEPCRWVGGDYVDVAVNHEDKAVLLLADVTGKGLPAALVASELHAMVHATLRTGADASVIMNTLNAHLCEYLTDGMFATMICIVLDTATGKMLAINAGHPPPVILAPDGSIETLPRGANPPLGVIPEDLTAAESDMPAGSLLVLFSDGLSELERDDGTMLYEPGLADELAAVYKDSHAGSIEEISAAVTTHLDGIQGSRLPADDRTYLLARRPNV